GKRERLFGAPGEDQWVPTLESNDAASRLGVLQQELSDLWLRCGSTPVTLAYVHQLCLRTELEQSGVAQSVIEDDLGLLQQAHSAQGDQIWLARTGAHQPDFCSPRRRGSPLRLPLLVARHGKTLPRRRW